MGEIIRCASLKMSLLRPQEDSGSLQVQLAVIRWRDDLILSSGKNIMRWNNCFRRSPQHALYFSIRSLNLNNYMFHRTTLLHTCPFWLQLMAVLFEEKYIWNSGLAEKFALCYWTLDSTKDLQISGETMWAVTVQSLGLKINLHWWKPRPPPQLASSHEPSCTVLHTVYSSHISAASRISSSLLHSSIFFMYSAVLRNLEYTHTYHWFFNIVKWIDW